MDPGDYATNVLTSDNFAAIQYEYFESQPAPNASARDNLQRLEYECRKEGRLVHYDLMRGGLWSFVPTNASDSPWSTAPVSSIAHSSNVVLEEKERGIYEVADLAKSRQQLPTNVTTSNIAGSPSTPVDDALRNGLVNARGVIHNSTIRSPNEVAPPIIGRTGSGTLQDIAAQEHIHSCVIAAVLGALVHQLCHNSRLLPLNSCTLLMPRDVSTIRSSHTADEQNASTLMVVTLDVSLTSLGWLVVKSCSDIISGIQALPDVISGHSKKEVAVGSSLWLAPSGAAAAYHGPLDDQEYQNSQDATKNELEQENHKPTLSSTQIKKWKSQCLEWFSKKGLHTNAVAHDSWVYVHILDGNVMFQGTELDHYVSTANEPLVIPWPAQFCFVTSSRAIGEVFSDINPEELVEDPLDFAQNWLTSSEERNAVVSRRKKERQDQELLRKAQTDANHKPLLPISSSPAALRRPSNAGAMYPTPPDALHHHVGVTPNFDGGTVTPGPLTAFPSMEGNAIIPSSSQALEVDVDMWPAAEKKDRSLGPDAYQDPDDLFGEIEGDLFGTDVTDADFSFFDQPDDFPPLSKPSQIEQVDKLLSEADVLDSGIIHVDDNREPSPIDVEKESEGVLESTVENTEGPILALNVAPTSAEVTDKPSFSESSAVDTVQKGPERIASPPFDKTIIFKRLMHDLTTSQSSKKSRKASLFDKIDFDDSLSSVSRKYGENGLFGFADLKDSISQDKRSHLPQSEGSNGSEPAQLHFGSGHARHGIDKEHAVSLENSDPKLDLLDIGIGTQEQTLNRTITSSRPQSASDYKSTAFNQEEPISTHISRLVQSPDLLNGFQKMLSRVDLDSSPLAAFIATPEPAKDISNLTDLERIGTAQIIADQAISCTLHIPGETLANTTNDAETSTSQNRCPIQELLSTMKGCLKEFRNCNMRSFLEIQGIPAFQASRLPPRPVPPPPRGLSSLELSKTNNPFLMPSSRLELRRADHKLSVLPSAINFWENLGLAPSGGNKDISAICVYPDLQGISLYANSFLDQMRSQYESLRLGSHDRLNSKDLTDGLLAFPHDVARQDSARSLAIMRETIGKLGRILASSPIEQQNLVVYFAYPLDDARLLVYVCSAFQHLFAMYKKALSEKKMSNTNELVLQLIPLDFIYTPWSLVVPSSAQYSHLALEVYDRCIIFGTAVSKPAILLEQPLPKMIDFKLAVNPSAALLQENTCLHIAYARSIDDRWITAAWTDNKGAQQMTSSYCLGRRHEEVVMSFFDIAKEIWATTMDVTSRKKIHWRLMIVKVGIMEIEEVEAWTRLSQIETVSNVSLTLITANANSTLRLLPTPLTLIPTAASSQSVITPASTPQPSQTTFGSQENVATPSKETQNAGTPGDAPQEADNDTFLIDFTDQTWGAVLSHRLNNSNSLLDYNPALISGCIIKRTGMHSDNAPVIMEVSIIQSEVVGNPRTFHESLLREVLAYYRGLGTLARVRGIVDSKTDCRPWHIAAVEKAVRALYILL